MNKKELGAFYSTNVDEIFKDFEAVVDGKVIIDPFCGEKDLIKWCRKNGSKKDFGCDINPNVRPDLVINSITKPLNYSVYDIVVTNPPYLLNNKTKTKTPFKLWNVNDLYKASLLSIAETANEILAIVPSNMIFDNDIKFRKRFYSMMEIKSIKCFDKQVFDDTNVRVCVIHAVKGKTTHINNFELYNQSIGKLWIKLLENTNKDFSRLQIGNDSNCNITINTTDTGSKGGEIKAYYSKEPFYGKISDRNKMTFVAPKELTKTEQEYMIVKFNKILNYMRKRYSSLFLTNFLAGKDSVMRKRISFKDSLSLMSVIYNNMEKKNDKCSDTK